jgi:iron(III) transport system substrate-binding protein
MVRNARKTSVLGGIVTLLLAFASLSGARAADPALVSRIANYNAADRSAYLEAGARSEGKLLVYTVGAQIDPLLAAFRKKYPFMSVQAYKGDASEVDRRVLEEYGAGTYNVDAYELNDYALAPLLAQNYLSNFWSPELANYPADAVEAGRHWVIMRTDLISLGFNTDSVSPDEAPHSNADLLDPKWKNRLGMYGQPAAINMWVGTILASGGIEFLRKIATQNPRIYNLGGRGVANLIVSGEAPVVINARRSHMVASQHDGAHVAWRAIGPVYASASAAAIASQAVHPYAAALFVDFMLSATAQKIYRDDLGYASMRKDLGTPDDTEKKLFLDSSPNFEEKYTEWGRIAQQLLHH